jgi:cardiolipin synthase
MKDFKPSLFGKANTVAQIVALLTVLLGKFYAPPLVLEVRYWSLIATVVFTVVSGFHYAWEITRKLSAPAVAAADQDFPR